MKPEKIILLSIAAIAILALAYFVDTRFTYLLFAIAMFVGCMGAHGNHSHGKETKSTNKENSHQH